MTKAAVRDPRPVHLYEVSYRADDTERKARIVASGAVWAISEIYKRRFKGRDKHVLHIEDLGQVFIAEPYRKIEEVLHSWLEQVEVIAKAVDQEIDKIEATLPLVQQHRDSLKRIEKMKQSLARPVEVTQVPGSERSR